jgi:uncharacterized C2H2 Zn-finger protein
MESEECPKCGMVLKAKNKSILKINMALHLNKHETRGL